MPPAVHFEAKLYALRKSKDGLIVSFVVHPNDTPTDLITAPIGEQYIVALAPYIESPSVEATTRKDEGSHLRPAEGVTPKERYAAMSEGDKAVARAALHCKDREFQEWAAARDKFPLPWNKLDAVTINFVRRECGIKTRAEIATNPEALRRFLALEEEYRMATT